MPEYWITGTYIRSPAIKGVVYVVPLPSGSKTQVVPRGRGIRVPAEYEADFLDQILVSAMASKNVVWLNATDTLQKVRDWIASGAPGPKNDDAHIEGIEMLPAQVVLKPGDSQQLIVHAHFSDGHVALGFANSLPVVRARGEAARRGFEFR